MEFRDSTLTCVECKSSFLFTADDQRYHSEKGYTEPKRCPACRANRRQTRTGGAGGGGGSGFGGGSNSFSAGAGGMGGAPRKMFPATCGECGQTTEVPFQPRGDRPVYCNNCFSKRRRSMGAGAGGEGGPRF